MDAIQAAYGSYLEVVFERVRLLADGCPDALRPALTYHLRGLPMSKGFRPALVVACHLLSDNIISRSELVTRGVAMQLLHEATLIIDDVLDRGTMRRGQRCVHGVHGRIPALVAAAWCMSKVGRLFATQSYLIEATADFNDVVGVAETLQWKARLWKRPIPLQTWQKIAHGDTGGLFRLAAKYAEVYPALQCTAHDLGHALDALTYLYHGLDDIIDILDEGEFAGGGSQDIRDDIPTLLTCFTTGRSKDALAGVIPEALGFLKPWATIVHPPELAPFFTDLKTIYERVVL